MGLELSIEKYTTESKDSLFPESVSKPWHSLQTKPSLINRLEVEIFCGYKHSNAMSAYQNNGKLPPFSMTTPGMIFFNWIYSTKYGFPSMEQTSNQIRELLVS